MRFSGPTAELLERDDILRSVFLHGASEGHDRRRPRGAASRATASRAAGRSSGRCSRSPG